MLCLVPLLLGQFVAGGPGILCELAEQSHTGKGHLLHCPNPTRKAEEEEANLSHALQDLLEKWVTS